MLSRVDFRRVDDLGGWLAAGVGDIWLVVGIWRFGDLSSRKCRLIVG